MIVLFELNCNVTNKDFGDYPKIKIKNKFCYLGCFLFNIDLGCPG